MFAAGVYEPLEAEGKACAFVRGGEVLVVVVPRGEVVEGTLTGLPGGRWRDVLHGEERSFATRTPLAELAGERGIAVYERA